MHTDTLIISTRADDTPVAMNTSLALRPRFLETLLHEKEPGSLEKWLAPALGQGARG